MVRAGNEEWRSIRHHHISDLFYHGISLLSRSQRAQPGLTPRLFFVAKCRKSAERGGFRRPAENFFTCRKIQAPDPP